MNSHSQELKVPAEQGTPEMLSTALDPTFASATEIVELLFVDDADNDVRRILDLIESELGWHTSVVHGTDAGLEWIERENPQIVLVQSLQPGSAEFIEIVREKFGEIPVVLLTGDGEERSALHALQAGAASYVPREQADTDLIETLSRVFASAQMRTRRRRLNSFLTSSKVEFEIENDPALIPPLVAALQEQLISLGVCTPNDTLRLGIALEEALLNGMHHGNLEVSSNQRQENGECAYHAEIQRRRRVAPYCNRRLHISADISPSEGTIVIRDEGTGFDVAGLPDPTDPENLTRVGSRGVLLLRTFMDDVVFNAAGNEVKLVRRRRN
jgi:DNA-binding NarL/FixJ family response regulator/anti-sigma regulatory factor (Ser/Thr protein kinase)